MPKIRVEQPRKMIKMTLITTDQDGNDTVWADHLEVEALDLDFNHNREEIVSDPAMGAALAGAPPEVIASLPGRQVAWMHVSTDVTITYQINLRVPGSGLSEFRPAP